MTAAIKTLGVLCAAVGLLLLLFGWQPVSRPCETLGHSFKLSGDCK
jgi:hypothetical protein